MNYDLTGQQWQIAKEYTEFCAREIAPLAETLDRATPDEAGAIMKDNIGKLGKTGFLAMIHDKQYGGTGHDLISFALAGEILARACPATYLSALASSVMFGQAVNLFGTSTQKERYLPGILRGEKIGAYAFYESDPGSDQSRITTSAEKKGDAWILNGVKSFITNAPIADFFLVSAVTGPGKFACFIVEADRPGFSPGAVHEKMGFRGSPTAACRAWRRSWSRRRRAAVRRASSGAMPGCTPGAGLR